MVTLVCIATFFRRLGGDKVEFGGQLTIDKRIYGVRSADFVDYLTAGRVVRAAWDPNMITDLGDGSFRLKQEPYLFAGVLQVAISVDVSVKTEPNGGLRLTSRDINCKAGVGELTDIDLGIELDGALAPQKDRIARIKGDFGYTTSGTLIGPLKLLPDPVLSAAAGAVNLGILAYARDRFVTGIDADYRRWATMRR